MYKAALIALMTASISTGATAQDAQSMSYPPKPPVAEKKPHVTEVHGDKWNDDYFWLREKSNPAVRAYLESENAYTESVMAPTTRLQERLFTEMKSHIKEDDSSVPYRQGDYFYYSRVAAGKQYSIFCRKYKSLEAPEQVILDVNELAKTEKFMAIGSYQPSDDGNLLAYTTDNTGYRQYKLQVKDLRTGATGLENAERVTSVAWANDNKTLFYSTEDPTTKRSDKVFRHALGSDNSKDALLYEEKDDAMNVGVGKVRSGEYLIMESGSLTTGETRYLNANTPDGEWKIVAPKVHGEEYYTDQRGDRFYIRTNRNGRTFELVTAPIGASGRENWTTIVPVRKETQLEDIELFKDYLVLAERTNGLQQLRILDLKADAKFSGGEPLVKFPEPTYTAFASNNRVWDTHTLRYNYQSPITPPSVFDYDMAKQASTLLKEQEVPGGFDRKNYALERVYATARDGVKVPVTVFYRKSVKRDGTAPMYLYAYGSYGYPLPVGFTAHRLALLDRGLVVAYAHIRGGGDLGKTWHDDGRMMHKMNTFNDFIDSAEYLIKAKYCDPKRIAVSGGSAGGLLMGAVTNMRPDLWRAVVSKVPFVDVINTMLDESLPLTAGEFEEWGNPKKKDEFDYMMQYSPYDNLASKKYPAILVTTSFNDSQVMYHEPAKYVAKLRSLKLKDDDHVLLLKTNMNAGHGGSSGRYDYLHDMAFDYSFLLTQLDVEKAGAGAGSGGKAPKK